MAEKSGSGVRKIISSNVLKDPNIVCLPGGLGRTPRHLVGAGFLDTGGILSPNEHFGTLDDLVVPTVLALPN